MYTKIITVIIIMLLINFQKVNKLQFIKYPEFKLGFTTQNFIESTPVTFENVIKLIDYASLKGFYWIELRDPDAILTLAECKKIAAYAKDKDIEVAYAIQRGLLDEDYWDIFMRGVKNASAFKDNGPGTFRTPACGKEFSLDVSKKGWTQEEFPRIIANAMKAVKIAAETGVQLVLENGVETIHGKDPLYFGIDGLFFKVRNVGLQFDTANPFSVSSTLPSAKEVKEFLLANVDRLSYIHLKSSSDGQAQPALTDNPLPFEDVFEIMYQKGVNYIAIELAGVDNKEKVYQNLDKSIFYLKQEGFLIPPSQ